MGLVIALALLHSIGVLGATIALAGAVPATAMLARESADAPASLRIEAVASEKGWEYRYADYRGQSLEVTERRPPGCAASTAGEAAREPEPLLIPAGVRVQFRFTSDDVIHTWAVERVGEQSAIPGLSSELEVRLDRVGTYRADCRGDDGKRAGPLQVVSVAEFERWLDATP